MIAVDVPGRAHIVHLRENKLRAFVCEHRLLCYFLAALFIILMVLL